MQPSLDFPHLSPGVYEEVPSDEVRASIQKMRDLQYMRPFWKRNKIMKQMFEEMFPAERLEALRNAGFHAEATFTETMPYPRADCVVRGTIDGLDIEYRTTFQFQVQYAVLEGKGRVPMAVSPERKKARFIETTDHILAGNRVWMEQRMGKQLHDLPVIPPWAIHELQRMTAEKKE